MKEYTLSVIIVTYNSQHYIYDCLQGLIESIRGISSEILLIDNYSHDDTIRIVHSFVNHPLLHRNDLHVLQNSRNVGFTAATNQGLVRALGNFILLLNPDVIVNRSTVPLLLHFLREHPEAGVVAPQLRFAHGAVQPSCRRFPRVSDICYELTGLSRLFPKSAVFNRWKMGDFDFRKERDVEQPQGAFLLTRKSAVQQIGVLDESFFMFFSDVDWCRRFLTAGWRIVFTPEAYALHKKGSSVYRNRVPMLIASHRDFARYFNKYPAHQLLCARSVDFLLLVLVWPRIAAHILARQLCVPDKKNQSGRV